MGATKTIFSLCTILILLLSIICGYIYLNKDEFFEIMVKRNFNTYEYGTLCLTYSDRNNKIEKFGKYTTKSSNCDANIIIKNSTQFFTLTATAGGGIGLGEAYFESMFTTPKTDENSLPNLLYHILKNQFNLPNTKRRIEFIKNSLFEYKTFIHWLERIFYEEKTFSDDERDIRYHYDRGYTFDYDITTEFWESYLGETRSGSCAIWNKDTKHLTQAQNNKWSIIISKIDVQKSDSILDVGSGWGYLCGKINRDYGANCTGITLSKDQLQASLERYSSQLCDNRNSQQIKEKGCIKFIFLDYRKSTEYFGMNSFDKVASAGMVEHVGVKRIGEYFKVLGEVLKPGGKMLIHGITMDDIFPDFRPVTRDTVCRNPNFISKYIFPGGCILHPDIMIEAAMKAGLEIMHREHYGKHYAKTLNVWLGNLRRNWPNLKDRSNLDLRFFKLHEFYLAFCEAAFRTGRVELTHFLFFKPKTNNGKAYDSSFFYFNDIINPSNHLNIIY